MRPSLNQEGTSARQSPLNIHMCMNSTYNVHVHVPSHAGRMDMRTYMHMCQDHLSMTHVYFALVPLVLCVMRISHAGIIMQCIALLDPRLFT